LVSFGWAKGIVKVVEPKKGYRKRVNGFRARAMRNFRVRLG